MGLRAKVVLCVLLLSTVLGGLALWLLHASVEQSHLELEQRAAREDITRLLQTLDDELALRDRVLREWSLWPDFYQFSEDGNALFAARNLNPQAVANSSLNWLGLYDREGRLLRSIGVPGQAIELRLPEDFTPAIRLALARPATDASLPCGLARVRRDLMMVCRRPLLDGLSGAPARGTVAIAEWLSPAVVLGVARRSGLDARLRLLAPGEQLPGEPMALDLRAQTGSGAVMVVTQPERLLIHWPLRDLAGEAVAVLELRWPRHILQRGHELLGRVSWVMLGLALVLTLGLVLAADRLLVGRLVRLRREMAAIRDQRQWNRQVTVQGHDEITELAGGANHLLGVIASQVHVLERLSQTDELTGLANRRCFGDRLEQATRQRQRRGEALTLLLLDVDHFKAYNDRYGHQRGDVALQAVAACLAGAARRPTDLAARLGGEEFALLLQSTDLEGARHCAAEIRAALAARALAHEAGGPEGRLTLSMGLAEARPGETPDSLYQRADAALYRAKAAGRDGVAE
ncbi:diguanylate cyclase [Roseateles sp. DAIF2]|uniref:GGDEF domain-containing protein n=1 Tax=Roseateles sp. DAIF2 TaxID=2714952 RepID=UPI0018A2DFDC|nr:diguanylate cyclase [Roseateles sp. DAIF2]QPF71992.1 diguanylate cyclase [Roseateles sp. DAIF2]